MSKKAIHFEDEDVRRGVEPVLCGRNGVASSIDISKVDCDHCLNLFYRGKASLTPKEKLS